MQFDELMKTPGEVAISEESGKAEFVINWRLLLYAHQTYELDMLSEYVKAANEALERNPNMSKEILFRHEKLDLFEALVRKRFRKTSKGILARMCGSFTYLFTTLIRALYDSDTINQVNGHSFFHVLFSFLLLLCCGRDCLLAIPPALLM